MIWWNILLFMMFASPFAAEKLPGPIGLFVRGLILASILNMLWRRLHIKKSTAPQYDPSVSRATAWGSELASKGPDSIV